MSNMFNVYGPHQPPRSDPEGAQDMLYGLNYQLPAPPPPPPSAPAPPPVSAPASASAAAATAPQNEEYTPKLSHRYPGQAHAGTGRQITRNRASYSCHACRRRKVKCDKVHPTCGNCTKSGDDCIYDSNIPSSHKPSNEKTSAHVRASFGAGMLENQSPHGSKRRRLNVDGRNEDGFGPQPYVFSQELNNEPYPLDPQLRPRFPDYKFIEDRLDRLVTIVEHMKRSSFAGTYESFAQQDSNGQRNVSAITEPMESVSSQIPMKRKVSKGQGPHQDAPESASVAAPSDQEFTMITPDANSELQDTMNNVNLSHLGMQDGERSRDVGGAFWTYITDQISELNQILQEQNRSYPNYPSAGLSSEATDKTPFSRDERLDINSFHREAGIIPDHNASSQGGTAAIDPSLRKYTFFQPSNDLPSKFYPFNADLLEHIPTKQQSHALYRCYITGVHPILPLIHPPTTLKYYLSFWEWYEHRKDKNAPFQYPAFIPLLYAIWYGGSVSMSQKYFKTLFGRTSRARLSSQLYDQVTNCLALTLFPQSPTVPSLTAFLIVQTILAREEEPLHGSFFVSLALRVAQMMGLHRDPTQFGIEPPFAEIRRRIWWRIVALDHSMSICSGLPPLISADVFKDVIEISEVRDDLLETLEGQKYGTEVEQRGMRKPDNPVDPLDPNTTSMISITYLVAKGRFRMMETSRKAIDVLLGAKPIRKKDLECMRTYVWEAESKLNETIDRIPNLDDKSFQYLSNDSGGDATSSQWTPDDDSTPPADEDLKALREIVPIDGLTSRSLGYHNETLLAFYKWSKIWLSLCIDKIYCVVYAPFLKNAKSKLWANARACALKHCHGFMDKFIRLATDPLFQPFRWSWPGTNQPMHAVMIMLVDLYERPSSPEAPQSRVYIDKVFALSSADAGIVSGEYGVSVQRPFREGGREAWDMIHRLREKAWRRAGLDPNILWTSMDELKANTSSLVPPDNKTTVEVAISAEAMRKRHEDASSKSEPLTSKPNHLNAFHDLLAAAQADAKATDAYKAAIKSSDAGVSAALQFPGGGQTGGVERLDQNSLITTEPMWTPTIPIQTVEANNSAGARAQPQQPELPPQQSREPLQSQSQQPQQQQYPQTQLNPHHHNRPPSPSQPIAPMPYPYFQQPTPHTDAEHQLRWIPYSQNYYNINSIPEIKTTATEPSSASISSAAAALAISQPTATVGDQFDWDQWDAIFGQYAPMDELMDVEGWTLGEP